MWTPAEFWKKLWARTDEPKKTKELIAKISVEVEENKFAQARTLSNNLATKIGENDPEATRTKTLISFLEDEA